MTRGGSCSRDGRCSLTPSGEARSALRWGWKARRKCSNGIERFGGTSGSTREQEAAGAAAAVDTLWTGTCTMRRPALSLLCGLVYLSTGPGAASAGQIAADAGYCQVSSLPLDPSNALVGLRLCGSLEHLL